MSLIVGIFSVIIALVFKLVSFVLMPIDLLLKNAIPEVSQGLTAIADFLWLATQSIGWAISASGIPYFAIVLVMTYWIFTLTLPLNVYFVKLAISWYRAVRP